MYKVREWTSEEYHGFWKSASRRYLDRVERNILGKLIGKGNRVIDIGGGYGRLLNVYRDLYSEIVIVDHSLLMLEDAKVRMASEGVLNATLVAANAYDLPFADGIFDQALMIRLLHHLEDPLRAIDCVHRVLQPGGTFILEYQNILNINNRIKKALRMLDFDLESIKPYKIGDMYWNFNPAFIRACLNSRFEVNNTLGGGIFWRRDILVHLLRYPEIVDYFLSRFFGDQYITHQIFVEMCKKKTKVVDTSAIVVHTPLDMFICTRCPESRLVNKYETIVCEACGTIYPIRNGIYDFR